jgi:hypothetical protein
MGWMTALTALLGATGGILGTVLGYRLKTRVGEQQHELTQEAQLFGVARGIIADLQARMDTVEEQLFACIAERAKVMERLASQEGRQAELETENSRLRVRVSYLEDP